MLCRCYEQYEHTQTITIDLVSLAICCQRKHRARSAAANEHCRLQA